MSKKKLEVIEIDKQEEQITLEEKTSPLILFLRHNRGRLLIACLMITLLSLITSSFIFLSNLYKSEEPKIKEVSLETNLDDLKKNVSTGRNPLDENSAKNKLLGNNTFASSGEVLLVKTIENPNYIIKFYSDGTAIKIMPKLNYMTRINALPDGNYGINEKGIIDTKADTSNIEITGKKEYSWGTVEYLSDGSAIVTNSKMDIFVRRSTDITENYISNNKLSYVKETKTYGETQVKYYYDGTIEITKNDTKYIVRNNEDIKIENNNITFPNNNESKIIETKKMSDGIQIDYYTDGGAIIRDGSKTISVRKSNSIIIKNNKIYEIVDNNNVTKSYESGNTIYYTNGSAETIYNNQKVYVEDNSTIKYNQNKTIKDITGPKQNLIQEATSDGTKIKLYQNIGIIEKDNEITIVPKDKIVLDKNGNFKELKTEEDTEDGLTTIIIHNYSNDKVKYRIVLTKSDKTTMDTQYIRFRTAKDNNLENTIKLNDAIWKPDKVYNALKLKGTNYIIEEGTLSANESTSTKLILWIDYEPIENNMQDKYFYGTLKVYAWTEE